MTIYKYRVREGYVYGAFGQFKSGDIVELDESTAVHNLDKLELAEIPQPPPPLTPVVPPEETDEINSDETGAEEPIASRRTSTRKPKAGD